MYVDEALNDGELQQAPRVMEIIYVEDISFNQNNVKFCDLFFDTDSFKIS